MADAVGAVLVMVRVKELVKVAGRGSETVSVMVYVPVSPMEVEATLMVKELGIVKIPAGKATAAPPLNE